MIKAEGSILGGVGGGVLLCAAQRGRDFEVPGLERGIHFRGVF